MVTSSPNSLSAFDHSTYISLTMEFRCNLKCVHCMIEDTMDWLEPQTEEVFHQVLNTNRLEKRWRGIIFTGSEVTLLKTLPDLVKRAKTANFEHVRIQTHGMHLANRQFCDTLLNAGVDEFFVSVAGSDSKTHDEITQIPKSFDRMLTGLEYLDQFEHVKLITNSVVTQLSYKLLPEIVTNLSHLQQLAQHEFWNFWPMKEIDEKKLAAPVADIQPYLLKAIELAVERGRGVEVKNFPHCMLGDYPLALHNDQPELLIDPKFWYEFNRNGFHQCLYRDQCRSKQCLGLNEAYTARYGWEKELLNPL